MRKAIVTGANGFVGSHLVKELIDNNVEVVSIVRNKDSNLELLPKSDNNRIIYCDLSEIENLSNLISDRDIDVFYHFAWQGSAGQDRADERLQTKNAIWTVDSVRVAKELGCKKFVGAGSIMEKETIAAVYTDDNEPGLGYIYGTGKLTAHCISKSVAANIGIDHIWTMITNAYGPGELSPRFINTTLRKIINNEPLQFTAATQNYDFIYITDVAKAFYYIGLQGKPFNSYTIGSAKAKPLKEFIIKLQEELAPEISLNFGDVPFTGINMPLENFSTENLERDTDFKPIVSFKDGVRYTMNWLKEMEE
jgi:UDP-glucose 4-epimerase